MKQTMKIGASLLLAVMLLFCAVSCAEKVDATELWENATYLSDTTLGDGANTVKVEISAEGKSIILTINTDKLTLGDALYEHGVINDASFFDTCNGMKANWNKGMMYWAFYVDGEIAEHGINDKKSVTNSVHTYKISYEKYA